jgi:hypothetical protein
MKTLPTVLLPSPPPSQQQTTPTRVVVGIAVLCIVLIGVAMRSDLVTTPQIAQPTPAPQWSDAEFRNQFVNRNYNEQIARHIAEDSVKTLPSAQSPGVTMANYNRLKTGMTYAQVAKVLGKEGTELGSSDIAGSRTVIHQWNGHGLGARISGANMNTMFQNGKLIQKAQSGLR